MKSNISTVAIFPFANFTHFKNISYLSGYTIMEQTNIDVTFKKNIHLLKFSTQRLVSESSL